MSSLTLEEAASVADRALGAARQGSLRPVTVGVVDAGGHLLVLKRQDGATFLGVDVASAKAWTALALAGTSRTLAELVEVRAQWALSLVMISQGRMAPSAGGVVIARDGEIIGAVGVSGDTPDNDEASARAGLQALGIDPSAQVP